MQTANHQIDEPLATHGRTIHFGRAPITSGLPLMNGQFQSRLAFLKCADSVEKIFFG